MILWSDLGATLVHDSGKGDDVLGGLVQRDDKSSDTLYFKFHIDPLSDVGTEEYFAAFQLFENHSERLAIGNSLKAWAYSAFNTAETGTNNAVFGDMDLHSGRPEPSAPGVFLPYELPRHGTENTIVFKVQYIAGADDLVTVWLNPNLGAGATEQSQPPILTTHFRANASFNEIRLRHAGGGGGWTFSDMAIATSFQDFVATSGDLVLSTAKFDRSELPLNFHSWQREQGLPQASVRAIAQTRDGFLWLAGDSGIARFDGVRFVGFGGHDGLPSDVVNSMFADSNGALWLGTAGSGLTRFKDGKGVSFQNGLPSKDIFSLAEGAAGRIWIGTAAGLVVWQEGHLSEPAGAEKFKGREITSLFKDRKGVMWVAAKGAGVFSFVNGQWTELTGNAVETLLLDAHCVLVDGSGKIWIGAGDDFVLCQDRGEWHRYRIPHHLERPRVTALAEQSDGTIWAGSVSEGLFQFKNGKLTSVNASSGLSDNFVQSLFNDRQGNLWVGTSAGLTRVQRGNLWALGQNKGLGYGPVHGLVELSPGTLLAAKPNDGVYRWSGSDFSRAISDDSSAALVEGNSLLKAGDECWLGTSDGLWRVQDSALVEHQLARKEIISVASGVAREIFAGTRTGELWARTNGGWFSQASFPRPVTAILPDKDGSLWVGTDGAGLFRSRRGTWIQMNKADGLQNEAVRTLYQDSEGVIWIGTIGGLTRWQNGKFANFTIREGLPDNIISQILEDDFERLWLGSNRGIAAVSKRVLEEIASGKAATIYPQHYGRAEGMISEQCAGGFSPAGLKATSGLLWFPTLKGIVVINPPALNRKPPEIILEEVVVDGNSSSNFFAASDARLRISPGRHRMEFRYTGLDFNSPEQMRFRYRLRGLDSDWLEAGNRRTAFYSYVPPGSYTFEVMACNSDGVWNPTEASVNFIVLPYFWQSRWFIGISSLVLILLVAGVVRIFEKKKSQRRLEFLERERAIQRERARIAADLHDELGSSLARISLLSELVSADKHHSQQIELHVKKMSQSADESMRALEQIVWAVRPSSDSLQSLVEYVAHFANELFADTPVRLRLDLPADLPNWMLPPELRHNLFLIIKESLTNVLRHASATEVRVQAKALNACIEFTVEDDGKGFSTDRSNENAGNGLSNMRRRAEAIGAILTTSSEAGKGTRIRIQVNLSKVAEKVDGFTGKS